VTTKQKTIARAGWFVYNVGPVGDMGRGRDDLARELDALCNVHPKNPREAPPKVGGLLEVIGWGRLPVPDGYRAIRSRDTESSANLAMIVRDTLTVNDVTWIHGQKTWRETRTGAKPSDRHPPRDILRARLSNKRGQHVNGIVGHAPPNTKYRDTGPAQQEWLDLMVRVIDVTGPCIVMTDPNSLMDELYKRVKSTGHVVSFGTDIEAVLMRGFDLERPETPGKVNGVVMGSDHHRCARGVAVRRAATT
jgi:hypothetical protein